VSVNLQKCFVGISIRYKEGHNPDIGYCTTFSQKNKQNLDEITIQRRTSAAAAAQKHKQTTSSCTERCYRSNPMFWAAKANSNAAE